MWSVPELVQAWARALELTMRAQGEGNGNGGLGVGSHSFSSSEMLDGLSSLLNYTQNVS